MQQQAQYVLELQLLYYVHSEIIDNEDVNKILWNENLKNFESLNPKNQQINIIGLYGTLDTVKNFLFQKCRCTIKISDDVHNHQNRGIVCFSQHQQFYYIAFIAPEEYYVKDKFEETIEISLFRYLRDLCSTIILLPSDSILNNWKTINTHFYQNTTNTVQDFQIKERQDFDISISKVQLRIESSQVQNLQELKFGQENVRCHSNLFIFKEQNVKFENIFDHFMIEESFLQSMDYQNQSEVVKDLIVKQQIVLTEQIGDVKIKLFNFIIGWNFEQFIPREIQELAFMFCWKRQKAIIQNENDEDEFGQFNSIVSKSQYLIDNIGKQIEFDWVEFLNQFKTKFQEMYEKFQDIIWQLKQNFVKKIQDQLSIIYNNRSQILLVDRYQFNALSKSESTSNTIETRIEKIQQSEIMLFGIDSFENAQVYYYFQTHLNQQMFLIKIEKNNKFQYVWMQQLLNQKIEKIFTFNQQSNSLLFYYDQAQQSLYVFNTQMGTTVIVYDEEKRRIISDKSKKYEKGCDIYLQLCYLQYYTCFFLIGQDEKIYKLSRESNSFERLSLPDDQEIKYNNVLSTGIGYYYCLANQQILDIYNFNNQRIQHINYKDYGQVNLNCQLLFYFEDDWFLILSNQQQSLTLQISNINTSQQIVSIYEEQQQEQYSNPYLDLIKGSIIKFGSSLLSLPTNSLKIELMIEPKNFQQINSYYQLLFISDTDQLLKRDILQVQGQKIQFIDFYQVLISRVPVQICTIDKSLLIPLNKGQIKQKLVSQQRKIQILQKVYELDFSVIELTKNFPQMKIYIVSIMGKQSSGKSYLLNRIFGTRFGVSSARCTDGIWMSFSIIDNILFILLDCEGLFGSRRTDDEETMLLTFITSISDATILNQDLTFDRHLNKQLYKLTNITENIRGQNLFQGQLIIVVRDVNQQEQGGAKRELLANIQQIKNSQKTSNFISKLFSDKFQLLFMSHFQAQPFENDIITLRQKLLQNAKEANNNWSDTNELTKVIKIMLVQLELQDYRSLDEIQEEDNINNLIKRTKDLWQSQLDGDNNLNFLNKDETYHMLFQTYYYDPIKPTSIQHNNVLKQVEYKLNVYMKKRIMLVRQNIEQFLIQIKDIQYQERKSTEIDNLLQNLAEKYRICAEKCEYCFLQCSQRKNHEKKIKQQKYQLEEQISKNQLNLNELTLQFNECEKIQFESHQQLTNELELIKNQIKYHDQMEIIKKIFQQIQFATNDADLNDNIIQDLNTFSISSFILNQITQYVIDRQLVMMQLEVQQIVENQQLEIIDSKINDLSQKLQLNHLKLSEQLQLVEKQKTEQNQQTNLHQDIQNLEINEQQLCQRILQNKSILDELRLQQIQCLQFLQTADFVDIQNLQDNLENCKIQKNHLQQEIDDLNSQLTYHKQLIMQKIQEEQIENYIEELSDNLNLKSQQISIQIPFLQKKITQKKVQLQKLEQQQNKQQSQQDLLNEISQLNTQIETINEQVQVQNEKIQQLDVLSVGNNYNDQFVEVFLNINCSEMSDQITLLQQQLKAVLVDIQKLEKQQTSFTNHQNLTDQIQASENLINQDQQQREILIEEVKLKKQIKAQPNGYAENQLDQEKMQVNQYQQQILVQQNEIKRLQEFKAYLSQTFILTKQLQQRIYQVEQIQQYQSKYNKNELQQLLNKKQQQLSLFFQIKEIVDRITDCKNQIAYSELKLQEISKQQLSNHHCGRDSHICDQLCEGCVISKKICNLKSGHNQLHLCENQSHQCTKICKFCNHQCKKVFGHPVNEYHNCFNQHPCSQKCNFSCNQSCGFDLSNQHEIHQCNQKECDHKCYFSSQYYNKDKKCQNQCIQSHTKKHQNHLCNKVHYCNMQCNQPGICYIGSYTEELREWQLENGRFEYLNYIQTAERKQCAILIQQAQIFHDEQFHNCQQVHTCDKQCPECNAYCRFIYGHDGRHELHKHRNKDQQYFTQLEGEIRQTILIRDGEQARQYNVGDSCTPETCQKSCERRGRAHYHLVPCKGGNQCLEVSKPHLRVRHQDIPYIGQNQLQDEILCEDFWQYHNWNHPVFNLQLREEIDMCNYYCSKCQERNFCNQRAWHTPSRAYEDHQFPCQQQHVFYGIDICFVVDTTQSMQRHLGIISGAINQFENTQEIIQQEDAIKYSIVTYWDHDCPYDQNQVVVKSQDFTNYQQIVQFLNGIQFIYSNDHCEAMFDGLNAATQMNWRQRSQKYIILIADSPPHGKLYNNYWKDNFKGGCPCGFNETNVLSRINQNQIKLVILQFNDELNQTLHEFIKHLDFMRILREISQKDYIQKLEEILVCEEERNDEVTCSKIRISQGY